MTYSAIADVSTVLLELLAESAEDDRSPLDPGGIEVVSPADVDSLSNLDLGLYPYRVETNNLTGSRSDEATGNTRQDPPLSLAVRYLVTAYASVGDEAGGGEGETRMDPLSWGDTLGAALQVFHDNRTIDPEEAPAPLYQDQPLTLSIVDEPFDDTLSLWSQFENAAYRPSATVEATPVVVQSLNQESFTRVQERETRVGRHGDEEDDDADDSGGSWGF